jgi:4'-phosphopantetheinyl transferase
MPWLSADERARAGRFQRRDDRDQFIASHLAFRSILAGYLGRHPSALRFQSSPGGKPELDHPDHGRLRFNLSHSSRHALIGISDEAAIGVDIEAIRPIDDVMAIARAHFHAREIAALEALSGLQQRDAFFACWTRKEAVLKALGVGLSLPLNQFCVSLPPAEADILRWERADPSPLGWSMHHLAPGPDVVGAVAILQPNKPCARFRLAPSWIDPR